MGAMETLRALLPLSPTYFDTLVHLLAAVLAGGLIGLERSYNGRPAGFRTHTLVCLASSLLMLVTLYQGTWFDAPSPDTVRIDPTRMAQGIMTGIGFLGAGVIFKAGLSVRGLTTAASIWMTSSIGVLIGVGLYFAAFAATALTLGVLGAFRWIENLMPSNVFAHHVVRFRRGEEMTEDELRLMLRDCGFTIANLTYKLASDDDAFEYRMMVRTTKEHNLPQLAARLNRQPNIVGFSLSPTGD